ncbi:MAG: hypothetical protein ABGX16_20160 [Pirellulales bacterium]
MIFLVVPALSNRSRVPVRFMMAAILVAAIGLPVVADQPAEVQPATYTPSLQQPIPGALSARGSLPSRERFVDSRTVQFSQLPAQVGDRVGQELYVELNLNTTITQSRQVAHQSRHAIQRRQDRGIEILEVTMGRAHRAHVTYIKSGQVRLEQKPNPKQTAGQDPEQTAGQDPEQAAGQALPSPVEGKSYFVARQGQQLLVTDQEGNIPPWDQYQIVLENMQTLGQPNPLARFLLGRKFTQGERIVLPQNLAEQLLGLNEPLGKVQHFELELSGTELIDGQSCALFTATIAAQALEYGEIGLNITGKLVIQMATCRTIAAELTGPIHMAAEEKTGQGSFLYKAAGDMRLSIHSTYASKIR